MYGLEHIRKIDSDAKVVMISGVGHEEMERIDKLKPLAIIHKPFQMLTILHILKEELCLEV